MINGKVFDKPLRSCAYSNDGNLIVAGFKEGTGNSCILGLLKKNYFLFIKKILEKVCVVKSDTLDVIEKINHRNQEISDIKFSPSK